MRWLLLSLLLAAFAACDVSAHEEEDAGEPEAAATPCDGKNDCTACRACAAKVACAAYLTACQKSSACVGLDQCILLCGADASCIQDCKVANAAGIQLYEASLQCLVCVQCPVDCAGYAVCQ